MDNSNFNGQNIGNNREVPNAMSIEMTNSFQDAQRFEVSTQNSVEVSNESAHEQQNTIPSNIEMVTEDVEKGLISPDLAKAQEEAREKLLADSEKPVEGDEKVMADIDTATNEIKLERDSTNKAFVSAVVSATSKMSPHDFSVALNHSRWKFMEGTFNRKKGDGLNGKAA